MIIRSTKIPTPLGVMIAITDEQKIYMLAFADQPNLSSMMMKIAGQLDATIEEGPTFVSNQLEQELTDFFAGTLINFTIPMHLFGTQFQQKVWQQLRQIPYGSTNSYAQLAQSINQPTAFRAVARANATNRLAILIPCHRVIASSHALSGYAGGVERKKRLLDLERAMIQHKE